MSWRWQKKYESPVREVSSRLQKLPDQELFLFTEAAIMNAGHSLSMYATNAGGTVGVDYLMGAIEHLQSAVDACTEIRDRRT